MNTIRAAFLLLASGSLAFGCGGVEVPPEYRYGLTGHIAFGGFSIGLETQPGAVIHYTDDIELGFSIETVCKKEEAVGNAVFTKDPYNTAGTLDANMRDHLSRLERLGEERINYILQEKKYSYIESIKIDYSATSILALSEATIKDAVKNGMQTSSCTEKINALPNDGVLIVKEVLVGDVKYNVIWRVDSMVIDSDKAVILGNLSKALAAR